MRRVWTSPIAVTVAAWDHDVSAVAPHQLEPSLRDGDAELALEADRHLEQVERIGRQVVGQRYVEPEIGLVDAQPVRHHPPHARLHILFQAEPPRHHHHPRLHPGPPGSR